MKYNIINETFNNDTFKYKFLKSRGVENPNIYMKLDDSCLYNYSLLNNIENGAKLLLDTIESGLPIFQIIDPDSDGYTSSAMLFSYLQKAFENLNIEMIFHPGKEHGLSIDISIPDGVKLVVIPDAGSNDIEQCKKLQERGISVLIIDHHQLNENNPYAVIINPYNSENYPNKLLSGSAVVYKFLQCLDNNLFLSNAENYLDLCALGLISDSMSMLGYENRRLSEKGIENIKNKCIKGFIEKTEYSMGSKITIKSIQWGITPLMNAIIRSTVHEEKEMLFDALCEKDSYYDYTKRDGKVVKEGIYERVPRLATNSKSRQKRSVEKESERLDLEIEKYGFNDNKILFVNAGELDFSLTGLMAINLANKYNKPCVLLRETNDGYFSGSGRNIPNNIESLRELLLNTGLVEFASGHSSAFGTKLRKENIFPLINKTNELLENLSSERIWNVDFELHKDDIDYKTIREFDELKKYYGSGIDDVILSVKDIETHTNNISIFGSNKDAWSFVVNGIKIIKFKENKDSEMFKIMSDIDWGGHNLSIDIIGKPDISNFNGSTTYQIVIEDYDINIL